MVMCFAEASTRGWSEADPTRRSPDEEPNLHVQGMCCGVCVVVLWVVRPDLSIRQMFNCCCADERQARYLYGHGRNCSECLSTHSEPSFDEL